MNLKIVLAASALALLAASGARAADAVIEEPVPVEVPVFTWTGFYVGIQGGYVWTNIGVDGGFGIDDLNGGLFGGYAGYNWQSADWVFGVEGDINGTWTDKNFPIVGAPFVNVDIGQDWLASLRARAGFTVDRVLFFATGGVAWTSGSVDVNFPFGGVATIGGDSTLTGWTIGAGAEYAFDDNWIGRFEYRYYDFGDQDFDGAGIGLGDLDMDSQTVTLGIAYKF